MKANKAFSTDSARSSLARLQRRIPLTLKVVLLNIAIGLVGWTIMDYVQTANVRNMFEAQLSEKLEQEALENRLFFNNYIKSFNESVKLLVTQKVFGDYVESKDVINITGNPLSHNHAPPWFPGRSIQKSLVLPRYVLLLDPYGNVSEIYSHRQDNPPPFLLSPSALLAGKSHNQSYMTIIDNTPFIITAAPYYNSFKKLKASLLIASPIDEEFLIASLGALSQGHRVALLTSDENSSILTSNNLDELPRGIRVSALQKNYLVTGKEFFDYGSSEMRITFASLVSLEEVDMLSSSAISNSRQERAISVFLFFVLFLLVTYWIAHHLQQITGQISHFCRHTLGMKQQESQKGDQLQILKERFCSLTDEVVKSREIMQGQAEEHTRLIVNNAFDAIITTNSNGAITSWNPMAEKIFGWNAKEATGEIVYYFIVSHKYHNLCQRTFKRFMSRGEWPLDKPQIIITALRRNKKKFIAEVSLSPAIKNHEPMMIFTVRDITKRKNTENKIKTLLKSVRKAKKEWEATFDNVGALIMLADRDLNIMRCNKSFADFAGFSAANMIGRKCYDFLPCDPEWFSFKEYVHKEGALKTEVHTDSGHWLYVNYLPIFDESNRFLYTIIIATDITELKDTQQILMESRHELKKRVAELEKFYEIAVNREVKMKSLKKEIAHLKRDMEESDDKDNDDLLNHTFPEYKQTLH